MVKGQQVRLKLPHQQEDLAAGVRLREIGVRGADNKGLEGLHEKDEGHGRGVSLYQYYPLPKAKEEL